MLQEYVAVQIGLLYISAVKQLFRLGYIPIKEMHPSLMLQRRKKKCQNHQPVNLWSSWLLDSLII